MTTIRAQPGVGRADRADPASAAQARDRDPPDPDGPQGLDQADERAAGVERRLAAAFSEEELDTLEPSSPASPRRSPPTRS